MTILGTAGEIPCMMNKKSKIYVAGHGGLVGGAIVRRLKGAGYENLILRDPWRDGPDPPEVC